MRGQQRQHKIVCHRSRRLHKSWQLRRQHQQLQRQERQRQRQPSSPPTRAHPRAFGRHPRRRTRRQPCSQLPPSPPRAAARAPSPSGEPSPLVATPRSAGTLRPPSCCRTPPAAPTTARRCACPAPRACARTGSRGRPRRRRPAAPASGRWSARPSRRRWAARSRTSAAGRCRRGATRFSCRRRRRRRRRCRGCRPVVIRRRRRRRRSTCGTSELLRASPSFRDRKGRGRLSIFLRRLRRRFLFSGRSIPGISVVESIRLYPCRFVKMFCSVAVASRCQGQLFPSSRTCRMRRPDQICCSVGSAYNVGPPPPPQNSSFCSIHMQTVRPSIKFLFSKRVANSFRQWWWWRVGNPALCTRSELQCKALMHCTHILGLATDATVLRVCYYCAFSLAFPMQNCESEQVQAIDDSGRQNTVILCSAILSRGSMVLCCDIFDPACTAHFLPLHF